MQVESLPVESLVGLLEKCSLEEAEYFLKSNSLSVSVQLQVLQVSMLFCHILGIHHELGASMS